jgi:hypothetical protein
MASSPNFTQAAMNRMREVALGCVASGMSAGVLSKPARDRSSEETEAVREANALLRRAVAECPTESAANAWMRQNPAPAPGGGGGNNAPAPAPAPAPVSPGGGGGGGGSDPLADARKNLELEHKILKLKRLLDEQKRLNTVAGDRAAQAAEEIDRLQAEIEEHKETINMGAAAVSELRAEVDRLAADANYGVPLFVKTRDERDQLLIELDTLKARLAKLESPVTLKARLAELLSRQCGSRFGLGSLLWVLRNQYGFKPTEIDLVALIKELGHTVTDKLVEGKTKYNVELALGNRTPKSMPVCWKNIGGKCSKPDCKYAHPELPTNSGGGADAATM